MKLFAISAIALSAALATPALADTGRTGFYAGGGYTQYEAEDVDVGGATLRGGYKFTPHFGVEGEASFGIEGDTADVLGTPVDVDLDNQFGVYGIGFLPVSDKLELFARAGYATIEASGSVGGFTAGAEDDGFGAGVGAQWWLTDNFALRGEYTRLENDDDGANAYGLSGVFAF